MYNCMNLMKLILNPLLCAFVCALITLLNIQHEIALLEKSYYCYSLT